MCRVAFLACLYKDEDAVLGCGAGIGRRKVNKAVTQHRVLCPDGGKQDKWEGVLFGTGWAEGFVGKGLPAL